MHHGAALAAEPGGSALLEAVVSARPNDLPPRMRALHAYAVLLTERPWAVTKEDVEELTSAGLSAAEIIDANQVVSYFNYVNRIAEGLGVVLEDEPAQD